MNSPAYFIDERTKGLFKKLKHQQIFKSIDLNTQIIDIFEYKAPLGLLGLFAEKIFLTNFIKKLLTERNALIKKVAEK